MKHFPLLLVLLFAGLLAVPAAAANRVDLAGLAGDRLTDADLARGTHVLVIWASWSPRCRNIPARVDALVTAVGSRARVHTVVFQEDAAAVKGFLGNRKLAAPTYLDTDGSFAKKHGVTTLPGLLVVSNGDVAFSGQLPSDPASVLERALGN